MRAIQHASRVVVPPALSVEVARPGLLAALDAASGSRLTVVSAGPGWGKTTAVAAWGRSRIDQRRSPVAWLSLEPTDDSPAGFWALFLRALGQPNILPPGSALTQLSVSGGVSDEVLLAVFRSIAALDTSVTVVMDDFHVMQDPQVHAAVTDLISYDLPLRLILLARYDPPLPLHRLRVSGALAEITARELAFDASAVSTLAADVESLELSPEQVDMVLARTEGWPTGVRLATLQLSGTSDDGELGDFGLDRSVAEYLTAEVLARHTPDMRDFLIRTSVAEFLTGPLADAIVPDGNGLSRLEELERANQFVVAVDRERTTFRYHPLFRDMLLSLLRREDSLAYRASHESAARWLVAHGDPVAALRHAIVVEDWELALQVFVEASPSAVGSLRFTLRSLLRQIPFETLPPSAAASLAAATLEFTSGHLAAMQEQVAQTRVRLAEGDELSAAALGLLENLAAAGARVRGDDAAAAAAAAAALEHTSTALPGHGAEGQRLIATIQSGVALLRDGDTVGARSLFLAALSAPPEEDVDLALLGARAHLAWLDLVEGRLNDAHDKATVVIEEAARRGWTSMLQARYAHEVLAAVDDLWLHPEAAERSVAAANAAETGGVEVWTTTALGIIQASIAVSRNRPKAAAASLGRARAAARGWPISRALAGPMIRVETDVALLADGVSGVDPGLAAHSLLAADTATAHASRARLALARGDVATAEAQARLVPRRPEWDRLDDLLACVEARLIDAQVAHARGDALAVTSSVRAAVELARPQRLLRPFVVAVPSRVSVVPVVVESLGRAGGDFEAAILAAFAQTGRVVSGGVEPEPLIEPLTERELAILAELPSMSSNEEIAARFFVSVNTVKSHLKHLYRKLEVTSRREAVRRGRELGLIP